MSRKTAPAAFTGLIMLGIAIGLFVWIGTHSSASADSHNNSTAEASLYATYGDLLQAGEVRVSNGGATATFMVALDHPLINEIQRHGKESMNGNNCDSQSPVAGATQPITFSGHTASATLNCLLNHNSRTEYLVAGNTNGIHKTKTINPFTSAIVYFNDANSCPPSAGCLFVTISDPATNFYVNTVSVNWTATILGFGAWCL